jgi:Periplasmic copper-binding protein (NosD)
MRSSILFAALGLVIMPMVGITSAQAQATRTWVSGVGDDVNPCSRTAPCKTFAGAISKTQAGGEINCLDPGGFGGVTITKSLTIKCHYTEGGVLVAGTNAIVINALATDNVTLKGLDINGIGVGAQTSLVGVKVLQAANVHIIDSEIYRFKTGVDVNPTSTAKVVVADSHIHDNGVGVVSAPAGAGVGFIVTTLRNNLIANNGCGIGVSSAATNASTPDNTGNGCGVAAPPGFAKTTVDEIYHNGIYDNNIGVLTRGTGTAEIAYNEITDNSVFGLHRLDTSTIRTFTPATNVITGNAASDAPNSTVGLTKRVKRLARKR